MIDVIYEDGGGGTHAELVRRFSHLVGVAAAGRMAPTGDGFNDLLDYALLDIFNAATEGGDVIAASDKAWILFYDLYPKGS